MSWFQRIVGMFVERLANRVADEVILFLRKRLSYDKINKEAQEIKEELASAESNAEREAVLDKIHDLVNRIDHV